MRFTERFLLILALIGFILRATGSPQGATMQLISFPPLALFYLLFMPSLMNAPWREHYDRPAPLRRLILSILAGLALSYSIIGTLCAALGYFPSIYAAETCSLACALFGAGAIMVRDPELSSFRNALLLRGIGICGVLALSCLIPAAAMPNIR